jgi:hypothetical protein
MDDVGPRRTRRVKTHQRKRAPTPIGQADFDAGLTEDIAEFYDDPVGFVHYAFAWGSGELTDFDGPDKWQAEQLQRVGDAFKADPETTIREAVASGHGIGKGTETAWIILWAMSTRPHLNGVVTANTTTQLSTKTWRELALWHKRAINTHWFKWTATRFFHVEHPETWFCAAIPNTEHNSEAFAGLHAQHVLLIYDEASGIPDVIWEVSEGAMTTPRAMWFVYGNPTKNTGRFRECFSSDRARWHTTQIDSRTCKMTNKKEIAEWEKAYGADSDFFRVRVKGQFPRVGNLQFISSDIVDFAIAMDTPYEAYYLMPIVLGVDVARYGDDKSVIAVRQGRKLHKLYKFRELDTMQLANMVGGLIKEWHPAATFVDEVGVGAGVVDRLRQLGFDVIGVNAGSKPYDEVTYYNKRAEMWDGMRGWLAGPADLPHHDPELRASLVGVEYGFDDKERMRLERKQDMKRRGLDSPDEGDAIAHTFAEPLGDPRANSFEPEDNFEPEIAEGEI